MRKLSLEEKKSVNAGAASMMGIATGILTVTGILNLFVDLFNRYFRKGSNSIQTGFSNCGESLRDCMSVHPEIWASQDEPSNRITIFPDQHNN